MSDTSQGRRQLTKLLSALAAATGIWLVFAVAAPAATEHFCNSCNIGPGGQAFGFSPHNNTLVYNHNLNAISVYIGAGVTGCDAIAHGYNEVTHSYANPCNSYAQIEDDDQYTEVANGHSDY